jgi:predicted HAD superfamily phosphohydrolase YqeG
MSSVYMLFSVLSRFFIIAIMLKPTLALKSFRQLDPGRLQRLGVKRVILDKDDTLCPHLGLTVDPAL